MVHGIVKSYNGDIKIYSEPGKGTSVNVYMPCMEADASIREKSVGEVISSGKERILLVDDEEYIIKMMKEMIERLGYRINAYTSSRIAYDEFRMNPYEYDLVITDQTMPDMVGTELAKELMLIRPNIPVIICTGFSEILSEEKAKAIGIREYISKPVVKSEISKAIRNILDHGNS